MRLKPFAAAAALCFSAALPAAAQYDDSADVNAAYERGKGGGATPLTLNELVACAAYWHVWREFHEDEYGETMLAKLDPALREPQAEAALQHWELKANEAIAGVEGGEAQFQAAADRFIGEAWAEGEGLVFGDSYLYAETLGACALPAED